MPDTIDARGLSCPAPVLMVKNAVDKDQPQALEVLVDNAPAKENVSRFLGSRNFETTAVQEGEDYRISARRKGEAPVTRTQPQPMVKTGADRQQKIMVLASSDRLGSGDDELGRKLMVNFIKTLAEMGEELWRLVFVNNGVKLATEGSAVLAELSAYEKGGLTILVCGTCLDHFNLLAAKKVGLTTNMLDIVTAMQLADKVITL